MNRDGWRWQREIVGKQSVICLQADGEPARYVVEQESNYYIHIKQKQTKPSKYAKTAGIKNINKLKVVSGTM
ncbi:hypothetical protein V7121_08685 [Neobacillus drentensis]|uniref:hypothetical protein n=1 Tax=Neobacillus drentensis TaxID=220684 RepID=UPI002FFFFD76